MADEIIKTKDNARLKAVRAIRDGRDRSRIFIEGVRLVEEALRSPITLREAFCTTSFGESERDDLVIREMARLGIEIVRCSEAAFGSIADTANSQGIVVIADRPKTPVASAPGESLSIYLHQIADPSNIGAVLRTAEAAGVDAIYTSPGSTDAFSPKALRASMGSAFRVRVVEGNIFEDLVRELKADGVSIVGAAADGGVDHYSYEWTRPTLVVVGSEAHGLPDEILTLLDQRISIPMAQQVESLNLAVSAGILLFEAKRQRS